MKMECSSLVFFVLIFMMLNAFANSSSAVFQSADVKKFYQFSVKDVDGKEVSMEKYRGMVVLVVNVASQCGFTDSNYRQFKELLGDYKERGFAIAAFPCNQFGSQEPSGESVIKRFVEETYRFNGDLYSKVEVNGAGTHPLFEFLKSQQAGTLVDAIKWNFTKFVVDRRGNVVARYGPTTEPNGIRPLIEKLLDERRIDGGEEMEAEL